MKKITELTGIKNLSKKQQELIFGGDLTLPTIRTQCGCITPNRFGILEIIQVDCDSTCPDGSTPISGLGS